MGRVSENSSTHSVNYSIGRTKERLEDLQMRGASLKKMTKPSDDPVGNVQLLSIRSQNIDAEQYSRNASFAQTHIDYTESSLNDLSELIMKAKDIAISQSSDIFNPEVRLSVAREIAQLRLQAIGIANRRLGNRYIFGGHSIVNRPFDNQGTYNGDKGSIFLEVSKDFFVPINLNGRDVFYSVTKNQSEDNEPLQKTHLENLKNVKENPNQNGETLKTENISRTPASNESSLLESTENIFSDLQNFENALSTNNPELVQDLLEKFDGHLSRIVTLRTKLGSISNSIAATEKAGENTKLINDKIKSRIEDADVAELFTDLEKQKHILNATYKAGSQLINRTLLDFIR